MVRQMNREGFANCGNIGECEAACPKQIKLDVIAENNSDYIKAAFTVRPETVSGGVG
jgi:succinate dehydrogenase / fumarate reductase iron-sulfur subunit